MGDLAVLMTGIPECPCEEKEGPAGREWQRHRLHFGGAEQRQPQEAQEGLRDAGKVQPTSGQHQHHPTTCKAHLRIVSAVLTP